MTRNADASLTPEEILRVAHAHLVLGIEQHHLASIMGVNSGRINEACRAIEWAMENHRAVYQLARGNAKVEPVDPIPF